MIFARKNARILHNNCPKNIFSRILGGGQVPPLPPSPTLMGSYHSMTNGGKDIVLSLNAGDVYSQITLKGLTAVSIYRTAYAAYDQM